MAIPKTLITGKFLLPDGTAPAAGAVTFRLSRPGSAVDGAVSQLVVSEVRVTLGADGSLPAGFGLCPNDVITPSGTYYRAHGELRDARGIPYPFDLKFQPATSASAVDIGSVPRLDEVPGLAIALGYVNVLAALPQFTSATKPDAAANAGKLIRVKDPGASEEVQTPLQTSTGEFAWVTVAVAPS